MTEQNGSSPEVVESDENEPYRTILELWTAILAPIATERNKPVTAHWAVRIVSTYAELKFADMRQYRDRYFDKVQRLANILSEVVAEDDECLKRISAEEDVMLNGSLYREVLTRWQKQFLTWELQWSPEKLDAAIEIAVITEIHKMFFGPEGMINLLDEIKLEFTDADREALTAELMELKAASDGS